MMKKTIFTLFFLLNLTFLFGQKIDFTKYKNSKLLKNANISFLVKEVNSSKIVAEYQSHNAMIPASTMKLVTTATALEVLGSNRKMGTFLEYSGQIKNGTLYGNIYIRGSYDPTLGSKKMGNSACLNDWIKAIKKQGIKNVKGKISAVLFKKDKLGINKKWIWEDIGNYYASTVQAISYKDNTYRLTLQSGKVGTTPKIIAISPNLRKLKFDNNIVASAKNRDNAYIYGSPYDNQRKIFGEIPANRKRFVIKGDIPNPAQLLVDDLAWKMKKNGIKTLGTQVVYNPPKEKTTLFYVHNSPEIKSIIKEINQHSNNHYAEHLFHNLTTKNDNTISFFWKRKGLSVDELFQYDGSGLSPVNAVSANFLVEILLYMEKSKNREAFLQSLPTAGKSGTLKSFLKNSFLAGKIKAKSGSFHRVRSYAGYTNINGKKYAFAIIINNANGTGREVKREIEKILIDIF